MFTVQLRRQVTDGHSTTGGSTSTASKSFSMTEGPREQPGAGASGRRCRSVSGECDDLAHHAAAGACYHGPVRGSWLLVVVLAGCAGSRASAQEPAAAAPAEPAEPARPAATPAVSARVSPRVDCEEMLRRVRRDAAAARARAGVAGEPRVRVVLRCPCAPAGMSRAARFRALLACADRIDQSPPELRRFRRGPRPLPRIRREDRPAPGSLAPETAPSPDSEPVVDEPASGAR